MAEDEVTAKMDSVQLSDYMGAEKQKELSLQPKTPPVAETMDTTPTTQISEGWTDGTAEQNVPSTSETTTGKRTVSLSSTRGDTERKRRKPEYDDFDEEEIEYVALKWYGRPLPEEVKRRLLEDKEILQEMMLMGPMRVMDMMGLPRGVEPEPVVVQPGWEEPADSGDTVEYFEVPYGYQFDGPEAEVSEELGEVAQNQRLDDKQVVNNAGGYVYRVDDWMRLRRLLCLGIESGTFYQTRKELAIENSQCISRLLKEKCGVDIVKEIVKFSTRVAKKDSLLFVLARCARQTKDLTTKHAAYKALPQICGIPTHLFMFMEYYNKLPSDMEKRLDQGKGWGRAHRIGITNWYFSYKNKPDKLAMQITKYRNRNGWTHRDVLRLAHPKPSSSRGSPEIAAIMKYIVKGLDAAKEGYLKDDASEEMKKLITYLDAYEEMSKLKPPQKPKSKKTERKSEEAMESTSEGGGVAGKPEERMSVEESEKPKIKTHEEIVQRACELIKEHRLVREHLPTELLNEVPIWELLLEGMPMFALIRNLNKLTSIGILESKPEGNPRADEVIERLGKDEILKKAKIHPFNVLVAHHQYSAGRGEKGKMTWKPNEKIVQALDDAFYKSFRFVEPTNKRFCIALDISGSMSCSVMGSSLSCREAAGAMAMVTARTKKKKVPTATLR